MDILTKSLDQGVPVDVIYMDLQKAFDTVPHKCLQYKIEYYGITGNLLRDGLLNFYLIGGSVLF